jgi:two-component system NtrC family sensor kinase
MTRIRRTGRRRSIAARLGLSFSLLVLILATAAYFGMASLVELHDALHDVERAARRQSSVLRLASAVRDQYAHMAHTLILQNDTHSQFFADSSAQVKAITDQVARRTRDAERAALVKSIRSENEQLDQIFHSSLLPAVRRGDRQKAAQLHDDILVAVDNAQGSAQRLSHLSEEAITRVGQHAELVEHRAIRLTLGLLIAAIVFAIAMAIYLYRSLTTRIRSLAAGTAQLAGGNLEVQLSLAGSDELTDLAQSFNVMTASLKEHQRQLLQSEKLAGLGRIAAGFAHEINNPLGVILGYVKLLRRRLGGPVADDLAIVEQEAERCHEVVEDLLDLTRSPPAEHDEVDLRAVAEDVVKSLTAVAEPGAAAIRIEGYGRTRGSSRKLHQVVRNLVKNAIEASDGRGRAEVVIRIGRAPGGSISLSVVDDGPGIAAEHRRIVFEPFFTTKPKGTGLGLAVSRSIARAHGGDLDLTDQPGQGTAFVLTLPSAEGAQ